MSFCPDGVNGILHNSNNRIIVVRQNYDEFKWMLPGGGVEKALRETFEEAVMREILEETGIEVCETNLRHAAELKQRVLNHDTKEIHNGTLRLFAVEGVYSLDNFEPNTEVSEAAYMTVEEIVARRNEFKIGYVRMVVHYDRYRSGLYTTPITGELSEKVEYALVPV